MRILILGAQGMLGSELSVVFSDYNPVCCDIEDIDISVEQEVKQKVSELKPTLIINAAAYTDVDGAEENQDMANKVNGAAVGYLAEIAKEIDAILIHYSTDYVFDGKNKKGYKEDDKTNPINAYGKSKLIGEETIKKINPKYYLIRTSWLYGNHGKNFVGAMIKLGKEKNEVRVVNDQFGKPTYAVDLAKRTHELIETKKEFGIYHLTNEGETSWFDFAEEIFNQLKINTKLVPVPSSEFPRLATRPYYSSLINTKLPPSRNWREALKDYLFHR